MQLVSYVIEKPTDNLMITMDTRNTSAAVETQMRSLWKIHCRYVLQYITGRYFYMRCINTLYCKYRRSTFQYFVLHYKEDFCCISKSIFIQKAYGLVSIDKVQGFSTTLSKMINDFISVDRIKHGFWMVWD